jgi:hypothetical protein
MLVSSAGVHPYATFWLDVADKGIKALAVMVGAAWTHINFLRSRTFKRKVESSVSGKMFVKEGRYYVLVSCRLHNVGQSKYPIKQKGTYLEAMTLDPGGRRRLKGAEIFEDHGWIEPGEQIEEPLVLAIPDPKTYVALRLNMRVVSKTVEWNASCILIDKPEEKPKGGWYEIH